MKCKMMIAILLGVISTTALAEDKLGIGLILGEPTGVSVKYWLDDEHAIDGAAAWSFWDGNGFQVHGDFLWHNFDLLESVDAPGKLPIYYGVGARLKFRNDNGKDDNSDVVFGIRIPIGISYMFEGEPFDIFAEVAPIVDLTPDVEVNFAVAVGFRYYLK